MKTEDTIMAEYLLKGGKMLSKTCKDCGAPLFETKEGVLCVVCKEIGPPDEKGAEKPVRHSPPEAEPVIVPPQRLHAGACHGEVGEEIEQAILALCRRVRTESRAEDCYLLMKGIRKGVQALQDL
ncbi:hypothetical protein AZH53_03270 [Methanomicrobiaceae archaeon CYW5]|uniref:Sjogren's syndrome/scleroderma autoantigen 1 family protein n=1 Tax=Methanovulcanius yangii TaxID=1789227 RepID=UPI0029C9BAEC|nr:Sjogren's syndrome/scleroderma autoantigen 1 family protein [Methanovulcanius yangii]MBT8507448.1 hypothetical protein [Methanovulcanius yangii]